MTGARLTGRVLFVLEEELSTAFKTRRDHQKISIVGLQFMGTRYMSSESQSSTRIAGILGHKHEDSQYREQDGCQEQTIAKFW